jgi:transcription elongation GreA/GreB family factor
MISTINSAAGVSNIQLHTARAAMPPVIKAVGRFDSFVNEVSENFVERLNKKIEADLMEILTSTADDRRYTAAMHKDNMKRLTREAIAHEKQESERFNELLEQRENTANPELLSAIQARIDDIVTARIRKETDLFDTKTFEYLYSGAAFLAAADMRSLGAAMLNDTSVSGQWSRTEENFAEESEKSIASLESRLKNIDSLYDTLRRDVKFDERVSSELLEDKIKKAAAVMAIFTKWNINAMRLLEELGDLGGQNGSNT